METIIYLVKINIAIVLFYGIYRLAFQGDTLFRWKRWTLLAIVAVSLLYPAMELSAFWRHSSPVLIDTGAWSHTLPELVVYSGTTTHSLTSLQILFGLYLGMAGALLLRMVIQAGMLLFSIHKTRAVDLFGRTIRQSDGLEMPFSFFGWIVMDATRYTESELQEILWHEETHVRQRHSLDTLLAELLCAVCWFNPFAWLLRREIRLNLEFLADRSVLTSGGEAEHYQFHLLRLSYHKAAVQISNNFNVSPLKKRIFMMNKKQTSKRSVWKYALLLPVAAGLIMLNTTIQTTAQTKSPKLSLQDKSVRIVETQEIEVYDHVEKMPQFPGGVKAMMQFLMDNIKYPEEAQKKKIEGPVIVQFVVKADGSMTDPVIKRSLNKVCDDEALRVIKAMPKWTPGTDKDGKAVAVRYTMPILFRLNSEQKPVSTLIIKQDESVKFVDEPNYFVDGKQISKEEMQKIDPSDIESINVKKESKPGEVHIMMKKAQ
jgi:TonB family protein